jgi:hypothetical protein
MLCSAKELGLINPTGVDGILELPVDAPVGMTCASCSIWMIVYSP